MMVTMRNWTTKHNQTGAGIETQWKFLEGMLEWNDVSLVLTTTDYLTTELYHLMNHFNGKVGIKYEIKHRHIDGHKRILFNLING